MPPGQSSQARSDAARCEEITGLAAAIHLSIEDVVLVPVRDPRPSTLLGRGKVDEIQQAVEALETELVIVDHALTPVQQRNLERAWKAKVLDRTALILEIFGDRAQTKEGRLQVELAHLNYQKGRLVRSWTHLERQRGGVGFLGGPGETQIEADRRQLQEKIGRLEKEIEKVRKTRHLHRAKRKKVPRPVVALVGYTNAGKSTLFNKMTEADVLAKDLLFATLDPTLRSVTLPNGTDIILSDTVGFISDLPTHLIAAFRATLEEVIEADLVLHVRDIAHEDSNLQADDVKQVLEDLGIKSTPETILEIWNKIDLLSSEDQRRAPEDRDAEQGGVISQDVQPGESGPSGFDPLHSEPQGTGLDKPMNRNASFRALPVSALTGQGLDKVLDVIEERLNAHRPIYKVSLPTENGADMAWLYQNCEVLDRADDDHAILFDVRVSSKRQKEFIYKFKKFI
ncbi:GTPase HflX [Coralliovum pocilloporae]|uniref:GTPase HflX n=1 Tax=Coralliovum pocilloporae TaxID=3066369 RepID=UPI0033078793